MKIMKNIYLIFFTITVLASFGLAYIWWNNYTFKNNPLDDELQYKINQKIKELQIKSYQRFGIKRTFPIIISDDMSSNHYGMAVYTKNQEIKIYLNKNRFKENANYMIEDVIPHEYAHAITFAIGHFSTKEKGHDKVWQDICKKLDGKRCERFVNHDDILIEKTNLF